MVLNTELPDIQTELRQLHEAGELDGFGLFLYAMVLKRIREERKGEKMERTEETSMGSALRAQNVDRSVSHPDHKSALHHRHPTSLDAETSDEIDDWSAESEAFQRALMISSIRAYPWNWAAWQMLTTTIKDLVMLKRIEATLSDELVFKRFWWAHSLLHIRRDEEALEALEALERDYPASVYVKSQLAIAQHNLRNIDPAMELFEYVRKADPFRLETMDIFSNILYIKDDRPALRYLAHHTFAIDKFNPIACCVIGNFYALSGENNRAILFYLRALRLEPTYIDAWTLVGHEYIQLKDAHHAIAAYRRAVDSDSRAYRAWYGLGQAYELLYMPQYALYYYERAAELRPHDSRMWCALGACYEVMNQLDNTLLCYHRAEANSQKEGNILHLLAEIYKKLGKREQSAVYYKRYIEAHERDSSQPQHVITALHFLAHYYKDQGNFRVAYMYSSRLVDFNGPEKEEVKSLMREMSAASSHTKLSS